MQAVYYTDFLCFLGVDPISGAKLPIYNRFAAEEGVGRIISIG
jgi:hypothetical protein